MFTFCCFRYRFLELRVFLFSFFSRWSPDFAVFLDKTITELTLDGVSRGATASFGVGQYASRYLRFAAGYADFLPDKLPFWATRAWLTCRVLVVLVEMSGAQ